MPPHGSFRSPEAASSPLVSFPPRAGLLVVAVVLGAFGLSWAAASPASAEGVWPGSPGAETNSMVCDSDVAGMTSGGDGNFVVWSTEAGFSVSVACKINLSSADTGNTVGSLEMFGGYGSISDLDFPQHKSKGKSLGDEGETGWFHRPVQLFTSESTSWPGSGDMPNIRDGVDPCTEWDALPVLEAECLVRPLVTSYRQASGVIEFHARIDVLPQEEPKNYCFGSSTFWCVPLNEGASQVRVSRMPVIVGARLVNGAGWGETVTNLGSYNDEAICDVTKECETPNESGAAEKVGMPTATPPNGTLPQAPTAECSITGWRLEDKTDDRVWTMDSPDTFSVILTDGHSFEIVAYFRGSPAMLRVQAKRGTKALWQKSLPSPSSPARFTGITGDGERAQLAITGFTAEGDIVPGCQKVITDEPENERPGLEECIGQEEFSLTSPGTWIRYGLHGGYCVLSAAFVPSKPLNERLVELRTANPGAKSVVTALAPISSGIARLVTVSPSHCEGPTIGDGEHWEAQPLSICDGIFSEAASVANVVAKGLISLLAISKLWEIFMSAWQGEKTQVFYIDSDTPSGSFS